MRTVMLLKGMGRGSSSDSMRSAQMPFLRGVISFPALLLFAILMSWSPSSFAAPSGMGDLMKLSIEDLMKIEITSVSKRAQKVSDAAAAVFVITQEDIRRSGVTSIPEALRMVPGVEVARIDANKWAISSRGFTSRFANKLLVLMDGRSVYSSLFSGVWWDVQDTLLEDIDRIEVIRGPGATLWGANAVNGVINIITKKAGDTLGGLVAAGGGMEEKGFGAARYGLKLAENADLRAYAKYFNRDRSVTSKGMDAADDWDAYQTGFRLDHDPSEQNSFTLQGDYYQGKIGTTYDVASIIPPYIVTSQASEKVSGGNIIGRWKRTFANDSEVSLQAYYDRTERKDIMVAGSADVVDADLQYRFKWFGVQDIVLGMGYRNTRDNLTDITDLRMINPASRVDQLYSAFFQDDITLVDKRLHWVIGSKFEHNNYTGFEVQPSTRLIWTPSKTQSVWGAVSRSVRTPARAESDVQTALVIPPWQEQNQSPLPLQVLATGNEDFKSEKMIAYELGYRLQPIPRLSIDLAGYYNRYDDVRGSNVPDPPVLAFDKNGVPYLALRFQFSNPMKVDIYGVETAVEWQPLDWWRIKGTYTFSEMKKDDTDLGTNSAQNFSVARHKFSVRSSMNLGKDVDADAWLRYTDSFDNGAVPGYFNLDLRLAWRPVKNLELALVGQNLLENRHQEFRPEQFSVQVYESERGVYGKLTWKF